MLNNNYFHVSSLGQRLFVTLVFWLCLFDLYSIALFTNSNENEIRPSCLESPIGLQLAYEAEGNFISIFNRTIHNVNVNRTKEESLNKLLVINDTLQQLQIQREEDKKSSGPFLEHIVNVYHFVYRIIHQLQPLVQRILEDKDDVSFHRELAPILRQQSKESVCVINKNNLEELSWLILISWEIQSRSPQELWSGMFIDGPSATNNLSLLESVTLIQFACHYEKNNEKQLCLKWIDLLLHQWEKEIKLNKQLNRAIIRLKANVLCGMKSCQKSVDVLQAYQKEQNEEDALVARDLRLYKDKIVNDVVEDTLVKQNENISVYWNITDIHEAKKISLSKKNNNLFCFRLHPQDNPIFNYHVELINSDKSPQVFYIHKVITKKEIEAIRNATVDKISKKNSIMITNTNDFHAFDYQIKLLDSQQLRNVVQRIDKITRKPKDFRESITSIALIRTTAFNTPVSWRQNQIKRRNLYEQIEGSTAMFFLSDVHVGGELYFPRLKSFVKPTLGDAVFWYDVVEDDNYNLQIDHDYQMNIPIDLPLLAGSKWIVARRVDEVVQGICRKKSEKSQR